ncbi:hypothetical protein T492DRAFT_928429 [Pavlovales sp. CCMP2436]|nr:hypothetical protein T492DRAFT_928429 [Pavlovales sp. CCMP2436]|mmetsp:Transcript_5943/g.14169  ORF Transcript_5943/g.14169 Transcript_5943/m.14169 type:complete len:390 (-) Transcript_5943:102-1271(-)
MGKRASHSHSRLWRGFVVALVAALAAPLFKVDPLGADELLREAAHCPADIKQPYVFLYWFATYLAFAPMSLAIDAVRGVLRAVEPDSLTAEFHAADAVRASRIVRLALDACDAALEDASSEALRPPAGTPPMGAVSLAGGGHKVTQYFGQWYYLQRHQLLRNDTKLLGCSTGAPLAAMLAPSLDETDPEAQLRTLKAVAQTVISLELQLWANQRTLLKGRMHDWWPHMLENFKPHLPSDRAATLKMRGRLYVALTRPFSPAPSWLFTDFDEPSELLHALSLSGAIPFNIIDRPFLSFRGHAVIDGGFANLKPQPSEESVGGRPVVVAYNNNAAAVWTENPLLAALYGAARIGAPLALDHEFVADITNGYRDMHRILHERHERMAARASS